MPQRPVSDDELRLMLLSVVRQGHQELGTAILNELLSLRGIANAAAKLECGHPETQMLCKCCDTADRALLGIMLGAAGYTSPAGIPPTAPRKDGH